MKIYPSYMKGKEAGLIPNSWQKLPTGSNSGSPLHCVKLFSKTWALHPGSIIEYNYLFTGALQEGGGGWGGVDSKGRALTGAFLEHYYYISSSRHSSSSIVPQPSDLHISVGN